MSSWRLPVSGVILADGGAVVQLPSGDGVTFVDSEALSLLSAYGTSADVAVRKHEVASRWHFEHSNVGQALLRSRPAPHPTLSTVVVTTKDRPALLYRLLDSLTDCGSRLHTVIVLDQSEHPKRIHCLDRWAFRIVHVTRRQVRAFVRAVVAHTGIPESTVAFALDGTGYRWAPAFGANLNMALLLTAGQAVAFCDDDVIATVFERPGRRVVPALTGPGDPTRVDVFRSLRDAAANVLPSGRSLLAVHEDALGWRIGNLLLNGQEPVLRLGTYPVSKLVDLQAVRTATVKVTAVGVVGDCGMASLHNYVHLPAAGSWSSLPSGQYRQLRYSRAVVRASEGLAVTPGGFLMNAAMAVDNRSLTPPFMPVFRNMDGVFSHLMLSCDHKAYLGFLPYMVAHVPSEQRRARAKETADYVGAVRVSDFLTEIVGATQIPVAITSVSDRLAYLGRTLQNLSALPTPALRAFLCDVVFRILSHRLALLVGRIEQRGDTSGVSPLVRDMSRQANVLRGALCEPFDGFVDLKQNGSHQNYTATMKRFMAQMGSLLCAWPAIWSRAAQGDLLSMVTDTKRGVQ